VLKTTNLYYIILLSLVISAYHTTSHAQFSDNTQWIEKRNRHGIVVYTSKIEGSKYRAVRFKTNISGKLNSVIGLILDSTACSRWVEMCKESRIIETISETESYIYTYNDLPFPLKDRDVVAHVIWQLNAKTGQVTMTSNAVNGKTETTKAIRLQNATAKWQFTPQNDDTILVEGYAHIDPNGPIPTWLNNMMLVKSPYKTMKSMHKVIASGAYDHYKVPFLKEPY